MGMILLVPFVLVAAVGWVTWKVAKWTVVLIVAAVVAAAVIATAVAREVGRYARSL